MARKHREHHPPEVNAHFYLRKPGPGDPGGVTVSRQAKLPDGEFGLTEYRWGTTVLWFIDEHHFTADERQACFLYMRPTGT